MNGGDLNEKNEIKCAWKRKCVNEVKWVLLKLARKTYYTGLGRIKTQLLTESQTNQHLFETKSFEIK